MKRIYEDKHGLVLIISLWILAITSLLCIGLAHRVVINLKLAKFQKDRMQCLYVAKAAIRKAINVLSEDETPDIDMLNELWSRGYDEESGADGYIFKEVEVGQGIFTISYVYGDINSESGVDFYGMSDEERKININYANKDLLVSIFDYIDAEDSDSLADNIIYWRGDGPVGYDDPYYGSEIPYAARKAPLKTIEELFLVKGFRENPELIDDCNNFFTVYTNTNEKNININTASAQVLRSIFISLGADEASGGLSDSLTNNIIDYRNGGEVAIEEDQMKTVMNTGLTPEEIVWVDAQDFPFTVKSNLFRIEVTASITTSRTRMKIVSVVNRGEQVVKIEYWHEE